MYESQALFAYARTKNVFKIFCLRLGQNFGNLIRENMKPFWRRIYWIEHGKQRRTSISQNCSNLFYQFTIHELRIKSCKHGKMMLHLFTMKLDVNLSLCLQSPWFQDQSSLIGFNQRGFKCVFHKICDITGVLGSIWSAKTLMTTRGKYCAPVSVMMNMKFAVLHVTKVLGYLTSIIVKLLHICFI